MSLPLDQLVKQLRDADDARRAEAAEALCRAGEDARAAAVPLVRAVGDPDEQVQQWASAALEELGPPPPGDVPALIELLDADFADLGYWAATLLGRAAGDAVAAVGPLTEALQRHSAIHVRQRSAWALGKIGYGPQPTLDALQEAVEDANPRLAFLAQKALEEIRGRVEM